MLPFPSAPSLPRIRPAALLPSGRALVIGFALLAATLLAYVGARETSVFAVRSIEISGAPPRVAAHVRAALRPLEGKSLLAVHPGDVGARLAHLPDVASATYDRAFPHTLRVRVSPAHTLALVRQGRQAWLVSSDGRVIRSAGPLAAPRLPRIWVPSDVDMSPGRTLSDADASTAVEAIATARSAGFARPIVAVRSAPSELTFVLPGHVEIRFGDASDLATKVVVAQKILPLAAGYGYVDVSVPDRPVAGGKAQVSALG